MDILSSKNLIVPIDRQVLNILFKIFEKKKFNSCHSIRIPYLLITVKKPNLNRNIDFPLRVIREF